MVGSELSRIKIEMNRWSISASNAYNNSTRYQRHIYKTNK